MLRIEEGEADVVCFGCMALNDHAPRPTEALAESHLGAIVIHPGKAVIRFAELLVGIDLSHSKRSYPYPQRESSSPHNRRTGICDV